MKLVSWFSEIGQGDNAVFGKKCANLGEMSRLKMPVPDGFAISVTAQETFLNETGALQEIQAEGRGAYVMRDEEAAEIVKLGKVLVA